MSDDISFQTWICPTCFDDHNQNDGCRKKVTKLQAENAKLREGLAYYAQPKGSRVSGLTTYTYYKDDFSETKDAGYTLKLAGKLARQILKEVEKND